MAEYFFSRQKIDGSAGRRAHVNEEGHAHVVLGERPIHAFAASDQRHSPLIQFDATEHVVTDGFGNPVDVIAYEAPIAFVLIPPHGEQLHFTLKPGSYTGRNDVQEIVFQVA